MIKYALFLFAACTPQPAEIQLTPVAGDATYALDPIHLPAAKVLDAKGAVIPGQAPVTWTVEPAGKATIDAAGGLLVPSDEAAFVLTAHAGTVVADWKVKVIVPDAVVIEGAPEAGALTAGDTANLTAKVMDGDQPLPELSVVWESSDAAIATVEGGRVTAVAPGTATITAKSATKEATVALTVNPAEIVAEVPVVE